MLKEFKEFAMRGNIIDLAIGVIIGGAFQKIVTSLVEDLIMPTIAIFTGKIDFNDLTLTVGSSSIKYGSFITTVVNFIIIAFSIFLVVRYINKINRKLEEVKNSELNKLNEKLGIQIGTNPEEQEEKQPTTKLCPYCFSEIDIRATKCSHCASNLNADD